MPDSCSGASTYVVSYRATSITSQLYRLISDNVLVEHISRTKNKGNSGEEKEKNIRKAIGESNKTSNWETKEERIAWGREKRESKKKENYRDGQGEGDKQPQRKWNGDGGEAKKKRTGVERVSIKKRTEFRQKEVQIRAREYVAGAEDR